MLLFNVCQIACLTCPRANVLFVLTCSRENVPCVLMCSRANVSCVLTLTRETCLACLRAHVPTCLVCFSCLHTYLRTYVPTYLRAITANKKNKFSIICFTYIFVIVLSSFFVWNKTVTHSCIALTRRKPLTGAMTGFEQ